MATGNAGDPTQLHLNQLREPVRTAAWWLVWAARSAGYPVIITSSRRSLAEQRALLAQGRTKTLKSKHLDGLAFDIDWYRTSRDDVPTAFWDLIGPWAERELGLRWGGRFSSIYDPGHFEA